MRKLFFLFLLLAGASKVMQAQITWDFSPISPATIPSGLAKNLPANITSTAAIAVVQGIASSPVVPFFPTTATAITPVSVGYVGASGTYSGTSNAKVGVFVATTSTYIQVILTPAANNWINVTSINWGNLSATTGPTSFSIFSSANNYTAPVGTATATANGTWALVSSTLSAPIAGFTSTALTLRIYGFGGTGTQPTVPNWRIDDLKITATAQVGAAANAIPKYLTATTYTSSIINENAGKIGIGTSTPTEKLDVVGGIKFSGALLLAGSTPLGGNSGQFLKSNGLNSAPTWADAPGGGANYWTATGSDIANNTTGNVGIGTTAAPATKLDVNGAITTNGGLLMKSGAPIQLWNSTNGNWGEISSFDGGGFKFKTGGASELNILNNGNVGIGTTTPTSKLHVTGDVTAKGAMYFDYSDIVQYPAGQNWINFHHSKQNPNGQFFSGVDYSNASGLTALRSTYINLISTNGTAIKNGVWNIDHYDYTTHLSVLPNGNVGIGTETPATKLDIAGAIKITDGSQGLNKVLTSDANGLATWGALPAATNTAWGLQGNASTNPATNFIGTTDYKPLYFRVNNNTIAKFDQQYSVSMGYGSNATGEYSTAIGESATASGYESTAIGVLATASGEFSTALGIGTRAIGSNSLAMGYNTSAKSLAETSLGLFNTDYTVANIAIFNPTDRLFSIGNGQSPTALSNALTILKNGNTGIGTSTPDSLLSVTKGVKFSGLYNSTNVTDSLVVVNAVGGLGKRVLPSPPVSGWGLTGNTGTDTLLNFIGTTDAKNLVFKTNNTIGATLSSGTVYGKTFTLNGATNSNIFLSTESPVGTLGVGMFGSYTTLGGDGRLTVGPDRIFRLNGNTAASDNIVFTRCDACGPGNIISARVAETGVDLFNVNRNGNVGIGVTTPTAKLDIAGNIKITDGTQGLNKVLTSDANGLATWAALPTVTNTGWGLTGNAGTNPATNFIGTTDLTDLIFKTNNTEKFKISAAGKSRLFYNNWNNPTGGSNIFSIGDTTFNIFDVSTTGTDAIFKFRGNNPGYNDTWSFNIEQGYNTKFRSGEYADYQSFNFGANETVRFLQNGSVGIGTTTTAAKLDIAGNIKITDGTQGLNKVLTSDANGLATWAALPTVTNTGWGLTGNAGTTATANFIGTTDNNALTIKLNNAGYGTLSHILNNNFLGVNAGATATNANQSNFFGNSAGSGAISAIGSNFLGHQAGSGATTASYSNFLGFTAGLSASSSSNSNFIGYYAGRLANSSPNANFIGNSAGLSATASSNSNFIGNNAGSTANLSPYSNFIGFNAGNAANGSSYSNLLGYNAGKRISGVNSIGANNIIIGTNISLPNATANAMNIGGVLYGTGLQNDVAAANPYETAKAGAKIGIGVVTPAYTLDVNGTTNTIGLRMPTGAGTGMVLTSDATGNATWASLPPAASTGWGLTGNAGTTAGTNFIGTTDGQDLIFKTNGQQIAKFSGDGNISISLGESTATGFNSIAMTDGYAPGGAAVAMGEGFAFGIHSTAMSQAWTTGNYSTAMGNSLASGNYSTAMSSSTARGNNSTAMGEGIVSKSYSGTAVGVFNDSTNAASALSINPLNRVFEVGNGYEGARSNALTILKNGNTGIGTSIPTAQLHTTNTVRFEKFKNNNTMDSVLTTDTSGNLALKYFVGGAGGVDNSKWTLVGNNIYSRDSANVGIGVDSATAKLHTKGTIRFESLKNNAAKDSVLTTDSSGNLSMKYLSADNSKWRLNGNNIYSRDSAYVGVGTDSATAKFHALGSMRFESFKNNPQGDSVLTTDISGNLKMVYLPYGSGGGGGGATYTFKNGVTQSNGIVNIGGSLEDSINLNLAGYTFNINNGTQKILTTSAINNNIGIGSAPVADYRMSVNGDATIGNARDTAGIGNKLWFNGTGNGDNIWMSRFNNAANNTDLRMNIGNGAGISNDRLDVGYDSANNWNSKFVVQNNGMVGIGTTQLNGLLSVGSAHGSKLAIGNNAWTKTSVISTGNNANADGDFTDLLVAGQNNNNALLRINSKGNVGIGTSVNTALDSVYRLSVNGKIRAKGLRVQTTGWADFVFEPGYKLKSLIEVEAFINKNKHLPEMLPATKVIAEGNDVGETQVKLLQKVEELTLYLIDQDKQLKKLQEQNKALETQNKEIENLKKQMDELKALLQKGS